MSPRIGSRPGADHITGPTNPPRTRCRQILTCIGFVRCDLTAEQFYSTIVHASKKLQPDCMMAAWIYVAGTSPISTFAM